MLGLFIDADLIRKQTAEPDVPAIAGHPPVHPIDGMLPATRSPLAWLSGLARDIRDLMAYRRARIRYLEATHEFHSLFNRFIAASRDGRCLRLAFDGDEVAGFGDNWAGLSLDQVEQRAQAEGRVAIDLEDQYFDAVFCDGLDRVSSPNSLLAELRRVLKDSGQLWIQVPLNAPCSPISGDARTEYWRMTPDGLRALLAGFDEILCSIYAPGNGALCTASFFYGLKPAGDDRHDSPA
ncbi:MAG: methyltransferase domain-containing protein [Thiohalocapsa sp.]|nr:methyltransferase domain-containing protein [Thiohalocapsa sp.]